MMLCDHCLLPYPEALLGPFNSSNSEPQIVCGICALELSNTCLGVNRTSFTGTQAEALRQAAIKWRGKSA